MALLSSPVASKLRLSTAYRAVRWSVRTVAAPALSLVLLKPCGKQSLFPVRFKFPLTAYSTARKQPSVTSTGTAHRLCLSLWVFCDTRSRSPSSVNGKKCGRQRLEKGVCLLCCQPLAELEYCNPGKFRKRLIFVLFVNSWNLWKLIAY